MCRSDTQIVFDADRGAHVLWRSRLVKRSLDYLNGYRDALMEVRRHFKDKKTLAEVALAAVKVCQLTPPEPTTVSATSLGWKIALVPQPKVET